MQKLNCEYSFNTNIHVYSKWNCYYSVMYVYYSVKARDTVVFIILAKFLFNFLIFFKYNLLSTWLTYSVYNVLLVSGVDSRDSSFTYNTQCSCSKCLLNAQNPFSPLPRHHPPSHQPSVCSPYVRVSYSLPPSLSV